MMLYLCRWPNGDLSIVSGRSLEEIDDVLDEVGDAHGAELTRITGRFAAHFNLKQKVGDAQNIEELLELTSFDETSFSRLGDAYPFLDQVFYDASDGQEDNATTQQKLESALEEERDREMDPKKCKTLEKHCCYFGPNSECGVPDSDQLPVMKALMRHGISTTQKQ